MGQQLMLRRSKSCEGELRMADVLKSKSILLLLAGFGVLLAIGIVTS